MEHGTFSGNLEFHLLIKKYKVVKYTEEEHIGGFSRKGYLFLFLSYLTNS